MNPIPPACFHLSFKTDGSISVPARNVRRIAPTTEKNFIHSLWVPSKSAPITNCATIPMMISTTGLDTRSQNESMPAISARAIHSAATVNAAVMVCPSAWGFVQPTGAAARMTQHYSACGSITRKASASRLVPSQADVIERNQLDSMSHVGLDLRKTLSRNP